MSILLSLNTKNAIEILIREDGELGTGPGPAGLEQVAKRPKIGASGHSQDYPQLV